MGRPGCIHQVSVADGFEDDCDELLHRCLKYHPLTYKTFCTIWKQMSLADIYKERPSGAEIAELSEEAIHVAKRYMLANTSNFEESVAGIFLVYALLNVQPFLSFAWLRLVPDDVAAIHRILEIAQKQRRLDVLYILGTILNNHTQYHAVEREHGLEVPLRKYVEGGTRPLDRQGVRPRGVILRHNEELDLLRELKNICKGYAGAKGAITKALPLDRNLGYTKDDVAEKLENSVKRVINGLGADDTSADDDRGQGSSSDHHYRVQSIKQRAMKSTVAAMGHLTGVHERIKNPKKIAEDKTEKEKPQRERGRKRKKGELKKNEFFPRLREESSTSGNTGNQRLLTRRGKRKQMSNSSEEENDCEPILESDDDCTNDKSLDLKPLNLEDDEDSQHEESDKTLTNISKEKVAVDPNILRNLNIESLPVFLQTEDRSRLIQIEIVDSMLNNGNTLITDVTPTIIKKAAPSATITSRDLNTASECSTSDKESTSEKAHRVSNIAKDDDLFKKPSETNVVLKKPDRSQLKKPLIKSKFKRLGMLPVANFCDEEK